ncbi:hypothetical protein DSM25558_5207 [Agrobacterium sp. DSM 25558]|uniref:hypothetical protein n=1 Tax=Agrobacterium sp. DSM 25558 TaxID=1907665 RepID=UPI0009725BD3|nr:hypothetical protein [Agrobacterium sp. DSM 25558]SCX31406.1 hypothetical protein DSM25558_5207 [Agrobacterium sp. DSM 25558]
MPRNESAVSTVAIMKREIDHRDRRDRRFGNAHAHHRQRDTRTLNFHIDTTVTAPWDHAPWMPPMEHQGARNVAKNSDSTARGFTIFNNEEIQHESGNEHALSTILQARQDVAVLKSQWPVIRYIDQDNVIRRHTIDYSVVFKTGKSIAIAVKPEKHRISTEALMRRISKTGDYTNIDSFKVVTEAYATKGRFANARHALWSRDYHDDQEMDRTLSLFKKHSSMHVWEFYEGAKNWMRFAAIWRLVDLGYVLPAFPADHVTDLSRLIKTN